MKISIPDGSRPIKDHDLPLHVGRHEQQRERHERPCKRCHKRHHEGRRERKKSTLLLWEMQNKFIWQ